MSTESTTKTSGGEPPLFSRQRHVCLLSLKDEKRKRHMHIVCHLPAKFDHSAIRDVYSRIQEDLPQLSDPINSITTTYWETDEGEKAERVIVIDCDSYSIELVATEMYHIV